METQNKSKGRIVYKHDIEFNWLKAVNFIPLAGEPIVYDAETELDPLPAGRTIRYTRSRFKIGDGVTKINDLPFIVGNNDVDLSDYQLKTDAVGKKYNGGTGEIFNLYSSNEASGDYSHAEGFNTKAKDWCAHTEGQSTEAGNTAHAEGYDTHATGKRSHAEGSETYARTENCHAEGKGSQAIGYASHAEGKGSKARGYASHAEGDSTADLLYVLSIDEIADGEINLYCGSEEEYATIYSHIDIGDIVVLQSCEEPENYLYGYIEHIDYGSNDGGTWLCITPSFQLDDFVYDSSVYKVYFPRLQDDIELQEICETLEPYYAHAEGCQTVAAGDGAHSEGWYTQAIGFGAHAEGTACAWAPLSHAEGGDTRAHGDTSHAEGGDTTAYGERSHAEGSETQAHGFASHAEGEGSWAEGDYSHAEGFNTKAKKWCAHTEGQGTSAENDCAHAEGYDTHAMGWRSHTEGTGTRAEGQHSHAEGNKSKAIGNSSHAEGGETTAQGKETHSEGSWSIAIGDQSHAEGYMTRSEGKFSHVEGVQSITKGSTSHAEGGRYRNEKQDIRRGGPNVAYSPASHAEGISTRAGVLITDQTDESNFLASVAAHAEGGYTWAKGAYSHAEGFGNIEAISDLTLFSTNDGLVVDDKTVTGTLSANNDFIHVDDLLILQQTTENKTNRYYDIIVTKVDGVSIEFVGEIDTAVTYNVIGRAKCNIASGFASHAGGIGTKAIADAQTAIGKYNEEDSEALFIVGNGTGMADEQRSNAFVVGKDGNAYVGANRKRLVTADELGDIGSALSEYKENVNALQEAVYDTTRVKENLYDVSKIKRDTVPQNSSEPSDTEYRRSYSTSDLIGVEYGDVMCFLFDRAEVRNATPFTVKFYGFVTNYAPIEVMEGVPIIVPKGANAVRFYSETEVMDTEWAPVQFGVVSHNFDGVENYEPLVKMIDEKIGDIASALDELHTYAQSLVDGGAS